MTYPDLAAAREYALSRLERELSPDLTYHSLVHTRDEVVHAVERLAAREGVNGEALLLLRTAAYFHDIGFVEGPQAHEATGATIAGRVLPQFGYTPSQIAQIQGMIMATRLPQTPQNHLEALLADADMDLLGRDDFFTRNAALRAELEAFGSGTSCTQWLKGQLRFVERHTYFTAAARALRGAKKQENKKKLRELLERCRRDEERDSPDPRQRSSAGSGTD